MAFPIRYRGYGFHNDVLSPPKPYFPTHNRIRQLEPPKAKAKPIELVNVVMEQDSTDPDPHMVQYEIRVATGDVYGAGTDANVYITVFGTEGETEKLQLTKKFTNLFERGRTDCFVMDLPDDLGNLTKLRIEHDDTGFGAAWLLDRVEITNLTTLITYIFLCDDWLDSHHGTLKDLVSQSQEEEEDEEKDENE